MEKIISESTAGILYVLIVLFSNAKKKNRNNC